MAEHRYIPGDPWGICDICGFKYRHSELRKDGYYTGLLVCRADYTDKHPQDYVRAIRDRQAVKDSRPRPTDVTVTSGGGYLVLEDNPTASPYALTERYLITETGSRISLT